MNVQDQIKKAVQAFINFKLSGWDTQLALECAYDTVYDIVDSDTFVDKCKATVKKVGLSL